MDTNILENILTRYLVILPLMIAIRIAIKKSTSYQRIHVIKEIPEGYEPFYAPGAVYDSSPYVMGIVIPILPAFSSKALWILCPIVVPLIYVGVGKLIRKGTLP